MNDDLSLFFAFFCLQFRKATGSRFSNRTLGTGPGKAHSGASYLFLESSNARRSSDEVGNETARFYSPVYEGDYGCLRFHFHMFGATMGKLRIIQLFLDAGANVSLLTLEVCLIALVKELMLINAR